MMFVSTNLKAKKTIKNQLNCYSSLVRSHTNHLSLQDSLVTSGRLMGDRNGYPLSSGEATRLPVWERGESACRTWTSPLCCTSSQAGSRPGCLKSRPERARVGDCKSWPFWFLVPTRRPGGSHVSVLLTHRERL